MNQKLLSMSGHLGYNRQFLEINRPNQTFYLPKTTCNHLLKIAKSIDGKHLAGTFAKNILNKQVAITAIKRKATDTVTPHDRSQLIEVIESELMSIHKANIARFRFRPLESDAWLET